MSLRKAAQELLDAMESKRNVVAVRISSDVIPAAKALRLALAEDTTEQDARRYRWLRDDKRGRFLSCAALTHQGAAPEIDAAIDAAMQAEREEKPE